jgi:hypothetical protein
MKQVMSARSRESAVRKRDVVDYGSNRLPKIFRIVEVSTAESKYAAGGRGRRVS